MSVLLSSWGGIRARLGDGRLSAAIRCVGGFSEAAAEIADAPRRRRVRRRDRQTPKRPEPVDLEKEMQKALIAEEAKWAGPSEHELLGAMPHPVLGAMLESVVRRVVGLNVCCNEILNTIFEKEFESSRASVDYIEFRFLEMEDKGVQPVFEFFLDFGYKQHSTFVLDDKEKPIHCTVLTPPQRQHLPKIVVSCLTVNEDLSETCQELIKTRTRDWLSLSDKYGATALGIVGAPWLLPSKEELEVIGKESSFAAWCMIHGMNAATIAISVNDMQKAVYKFGASPGRITTDQIWTALADKFPMNPYSSEPVWVHKKGFARVVAPVAELVSATLSDGSGENVPGSHVAFIERAVRPEFEHLQREEDFVEYEEEHYNHEIDAELLSYMHGCIDTAVMVEAHAQTVHKRVLDRAKEEGKVLTLDGSNEEDEALYQTYFREIASDMPDLQGLQKGIHEREARY